MTSAAPPALAIVLTTVAEDADAAALARTLVEERLAACIAILAPMTSVYFWKGSLQQDREQQLVIKTATELIARLETRLRELHPYELPEFVVLKGTASVAYEEWVRMSMGRT